MGKIRIRHVDIYEYVDIYYDGGKTYVVPMARADFEFLHTHIL